MKTAVCDPSGTTAFDHHESTWVPVMVANGPVTTRKILFREAT